MSISVSSMYNEILNDIQSRINVPISFGSRRSSNISKDANATNNSETAPSSFQDVLNSYINSATDNPTELTAAIDDAIVSSAAKYQIDPNLIKAVIRQESNFDTDAVSRSGAMGLMQLMPTTASSLGVNNAFDIEDNVEGGTKYLSQMLNQFDDNEQLALAAYNAGPGSVTKYGGIPPYAETQDYVPKVLGYKEQYILEQYAKNNKKPE